MQALPSMCMYIARQCRQLYAQGNMILRKFHMCTPDVKLTLFRTYFTPMYTSQLWWSYRKATINKLYTSYHNILKMFLGLSKFESTSMLCTYVNVQCCHSVIRSLVYRVSRIRVHWIRAVTSTFILYLSKSNSRKSYSSKSKSTARKMYLKYK